MTTLELQIDERGLSLPAGDWLSWQYLTLISENDRVCFRVVAPGIEPIRGYSAASQRTFQLMPTPLSPALLISGFTMHRIRDTTPAEAAADMVRALAPIKGRVLDTATGLGYAAIQAAQTAEEVVTIEIDPMAQQMARANPWSQALFEKPNIKQIIGNAAEVIDSFAAETFSCVIHDPPAINLAGELYSESFYEKALVVLGKAGRLFHYIGDPQSKSGARVTQGVVRRLQDAGFKRVVAKPESFGVVAYR